MIRFCPYSSMIRGVASGLMAVNPCVLYVSVVNIS